jgi:cytochrome c oxidase subunit 2
MVTFFVVAILALGFLITFQIAKASEYVAVIRGVEDARKQTNKINAFLLLAFLILGLIGVYYCNERLKGKILGAPASDHGVLIDRMLYITIAITFVVFVITQILLFWFCFKYQESDKRKAYFYPHNSKLEFIWTVIPAITLSVLVGFGIVYWYKITGPAPDRGPGGELMEVEIVGSQFKWEYRYPGADKVLGKKYYRQINDAKGNPLGQLWDDPHNHDDVYITGDPMHLVVNRPVRLVIGAKDVIHDVGLIHFRMKMDAVPGTPTTMWFTPTKTSKQMIEETGNPKFVYEISCDQMCGKGHTGMRGEIIVETQAEFDAWFAKQDPQYWKAHPEAAPKKPGADSLGTKSVAPVVKSDSTPVAVISKPQTK